MFDHYLMTRFNLRYEKWAFTKNNESLLTDDWMEDRMWLFENFCFPSVIAQTNKNFKWLLFFDISTTEKFRSRIETLIKPYAHIELYYIDGMPSFLPEIQDILQQQKSNPYVITTRIDNDDTVHRHFIDEVQKQFNSQDFRVIDILSGYSLKIKPWMLGRKEQLFNPFVSLIEKHDHPKTVWSTAHNIWKKETRITRITNKRLWLSIIHEKNKVNEFDGYGNIKWEDIKADFVVSEEVSKLIAKNLMPYSQWRMLGLKNKFSIKYTIFSKNLKTALGIYKLKKIMEDTNREIHNAFEVIQNGGIILYPTDTVWGIGCDATNPEAVSKIYKLKQRAETQSMICLLNGEKMMYNIFKNIPEVAWQIIDFSEKPTTLILDEPRNVAANIIAPDNTLGIRIVKEPFCFKLLERMKKPLVSTSANISGQPTPKSFKEISPEIIKGVDYVVNLQRDKIAGKPSTIIKLTNDSQVKVIRK